MPGKQYINYETKVLNKDWASKGGTTTQLNPQTVWSKIVKAALGEKNSGYASGYIYPKEMAFSSGNATAVSTTFSRYKPLILIPSEQVIKQEGWTPAPSRIQIEQFSLTANSHGAWVQTTDQVDLTDYYGIRSKVVQMLVASARRMEDVIARDTYVTKGNKVLFPQTDGTAADKTNVGHFRFGIILKKFRDLKNAGYDVSKNKLFISQEIYTWLRFAKNSKLAETLEREEMYMGRAARWYTNFTAEPEINLLGINIRVVPSPAYTYGDATGVGGTNEKAGTNLPIQWPENEGDDYKVGTGATNKYLECSIFVVGESAYGLMVFDEKCNTGIEAIMANPIGSAGALDPLRQLGSYGLKWWSGYNITDTAGVTAYFSAEPELEELFEV